ncbi:uncharacterized protein LOC126888591 [Diabrotica virgifera virgifera]|uniref:DUF7041 domain-containing protein n=2 Tax=Diabrotica virgifera virgifera TaxID=50390 RepID=A0ABM5KRT3_DIAVI|nr:uncharacterized protein LOC126888591 [Diabrotica virgifera virgifera]
MQEISEERSSELQNSQDVINPSNQSKLYSTALTQPNNKFASKNQAILFNSLPNTKIEDYLNAIAIKIPPFWRNDPEIWFLQVENQFTLANITSDATKFNYIVANLETAYISKVRDIIVSPPATEKHQTVSNNIVRSLWLGRLPSSTQAILATQAKASLDAVAELADTISEAIAPRAQISETSNARESTIDKLTAELAEMKIQLASLLQVQAQTNTYRRNRSNSRGRSYSRERDSDICWYHYRFGDQAQKCSLPCKHQENLAGSRSVRHPIQAQSLAAFS